MRTLSLWTYRGITGEKMRNPPTIEASAAAESSGKHRVQKAETPVERDLRTG